MQTKLILSLLILGFALFAADSRAGGIEPKLFDVRAFGAKGDGKADDTAAIQKAIDHVAEITLTVKGELEDVFDGNERVVAVVIQRPYLTRSYSR